jgi:hypothetical protein
MAIQLSINVRDTATVLASFKAIRVKRSTTGESGAYSLVTAAAPSSAVLQASVPEFYNVVGRTLSILRDSHAQVNVLFTGVGTLSAAQVASQINATVGVTIASVTSGALRLASTITGTASKIEIAVGSAEFAFGWTAGDRAIGFDAHIPIQATQTLYKYTDNDGEESYYYKVSYLNTSNGQISADSSAFIGGAATMVDPSYLSVATIDLVDARGIAIPNQSISFMSVHEPFTADGFQVALTLDPVTIVTDNLGHAEVPLVRGLRVKVIIEGTSIIRDIVVPDVPTFDLLSVLSAAPDPFKVADVNFPTAPRRSI